MSQVDYNEPRCSLEVSSQGFDSACLCKIYLQCIDIYIDMYIAYFDTGPSSKYAFNYLTLSPCGWHPANWISHVQPGVASTHLQRNPEDPTQDMLRARQAKMGQRGGDLFCLSNQVKIF